MTHLTALRERVLGEKMQSGIIIRDAIPADIALLVEWNAAMALETERKVLDLNLLQQGVAAVFEHPQRGFYLIAEHGGQAVGCLMITHEWSDWRNGNWWWLQSVYVALSARRSGVFRALHAEVGRRARSTSGVVGLRLYVEQDNARAQATYAAMGMAPTCYRLYEHGFAGD